MEMKHVIVILILLTLTGCRAQKAVTTDSTSEFHRLTQSAWNVVSSDSLIQRVLSSLTFDVDYTITKFAPPDSTGAQAITEQHVIKASGTQTEQEETIAGSRTEASGTQAEQEDAGTEVHTVETPKATLWDKFGDKVITIIIIAILTACVVWAMRKGSQYLNKV